MKDDESLLAFLENLSKFDTMFCKLMTNGNEFTARLEVHGNKGQLIHSRVYTDEIKRPSGKKVQKTRRGSKNF